MIRRVESGSDLDLDSELVDIVDFPTRGSSSSEWIQIPSRRGQSNSRKILLDRRNRPPVLIPSLIFEGLFLFVDDSCIASSEARKLGEGRVEDGSEVCYQF